MADDERAIRLAREVILSTFAGESRALTWAFRRISAAMQDVHLQAGEVAFEQGASANHVYFIVDGSVKLTGKREMTFGPKSVIGAIDAFLERPTSWTAVATTRAHLLKVRTEDWLDVVEDSFELASLVIRNISTAIQKLRSRPLPLGGFEGVDASIASAEATGPLHLVDRIVLLRGVPVFAGASIQTLTSLAELSTEVRAEPREVLAPRGEAKRSMLVVVSGGISATPEDPTLAGRFGPGMLVGGALALGNADAYELRAEAPTCALAIARADYFDVMEEHVSLFRAAMRGLFAENDALLQRGHEPAIRTTPSP
jgi:CRP-like cAMP-binding protein